MKIITYRVRDAEIQIFKKVNDDFKHELTIVQDALNSQTVDLVKGHECLIVRETDKLDKDLLIKISDYGVKYLLTRTAGIDHIDLKTAHELGFKMANVPAYSPTAIAELTLSMALMLSRKTLYFVNRAIKNDFTTDNFGFAVEMKNKTIGIIGTGKIGLMTTKLFAAFSSNILAYDLYENEEVKKMAKYVDLDDLLKNSDIISFNIPYIKGVNDKLINADFFKKVKPNSIIINTARGRIQDEKAILHALENNQIQAYACDVINDEERYFFKKDQIIDDLVIDKLINLYPRFIIAPHIGSYTDEAVHNMIKFSYDNLEEFLATKDCKNKI